MIECEGNMTVHQSIDGVITTHAHVGAMVELLAALYVQFV
jgi:hypothetical protein